MNLHRPEPPPPQPDSASILLMRAIGRVPSGWYTESGGGEPITDIEAVALMCGVVWQELSALIEVGITAGYLEDDEAGGIGLSAKGQRWWVRDALRRE